jgi:hypothetical protein
VSRVLRFLPISACTETATVGGGARPCHAVLHHHVVPGGPTCCYLWHSACVHWLVLSPCCHDTEPPPAAPPHARAVRGSPVELGALRVLWALGAHEAKPPQQLCSDLPRRSAGVRRRPRRSSGGRCRPYCMWVHHLGDKQSHARASHVPAPERGAHPRAPTAVPSVAPSADEAGALHPPHPCPSCRGEESCSHR